VSPLVAFTSNNPSSTVKRDTSNVPPPKSTTKIVLSFLLELLKPYAIAAAVGSLMILKTFRPAI